MTIYNDGKREFEVRGLGGKKTTILPKQTMEVEDKDGMTLINSYRELKNFDGFKGRGNKADKALIHENEALKARIAELEGGKDEAKKPGRPKKAEEIKEEEKE